MPQQQQPVMQSAVVADNGTPPMAINAQKLLADVLSTLDVTLAGCSAAFRRFYQQQLASSTAQQLLSDSFWYVCVCMFDQAERGSQAAGAAALRKRLSRTFSVYCYSLPAGRSKDMLLQYIPYIMTHAIEAGLRAYFASAGHLFTPAFMERVHAVVCTLFLSGDGGGHGRQLREALRQKLFNPANGCGPPPPPVPDFQPTKARVARDWQDIVRDQRTGQFCVVAARGGGQHKLGHHEETQLLSRHRGSRRSRSVSPVGAGARTRALGVGSGSSASLIVSAAAAAAGSVAQQQSSSPLDSFFPGVQALQPSSVHTDRPASAEFTISNCSLRSPLIESYLHDNSTEEASVLVPLPSRLVTSGSGSSSRSSAQRHRQPRNLGDTTESSSASVPLFRRHSAGRPTSVDSSVTVSTAAEPAASQTDRQMAAAPNSHRNSSGRDRAPQLARALGLSNETVAVLGTSREASRRYSRQVRKHAQHIRELRRAKNMLQRETTKEKSKVILGGRQAVKACCYDVVEQQRRKQAGMFMSEPKGNTVRATGALGAMVRPKTVQGLMGSAGGKVAPLTSVFSVAGAAGEQGGWQRTRTREERLENRRAPPPIEGEHMLYDSHRYKTTATRRTMAAKGPPPTPSRPSSLRDLRRSAPSPSQAWSRTQEASIRALASR